MTARRPFRPYPAYKPSGVPWLGEVPEHWVTVRAQWLFREINDRGYPDETLLSVTQKQGVVAREEAEMRVWNPGDDVTGYKLVKPEDYVISLRSFQGGVEYSTRRGIVSPAYTVMRKKRRLEDIYYRYLFKSEPFLTALVTITTGIRQGKNVSFDDFRELILPIPEPEDCFVMGAFLDRETAKIDGLVAKKERLLELLAEKRTALMSRAVTRGLEPKVKMKPSGIPWLGDIPAHWEVKKGSFIGKLLGSYSVDDSEVSPDGVVKYVKVDDLNSLEEGLYLRETKNYLVKIPINADTSNTELLLFPKRGAAIFTNKVCVSEGPLLFDSNIMAWDIFPSADIRYIAYSLFTRGLSDLADVSSVPQINNKHINPEKFPFPPKEEQEKIVRYVFNESRMIGSLISKVREGIKKLQEYRAALISAAVTGKIDVRGEGVEVPA